MLAKILVYNNSKNDQQVNISRYFTCKFVYNYNHYGAICQKIMSYRNYRQSQSIHVFRGFYAINTNTSDYFN